MDSTTSLKDFTAHLEREGLVTKVGGAKLTCCQKCEGEGGLAATIGPEGSPRITGWYICPVCNGDGLAPVATIWAWHINPYVVETARRDRARMWMQELEGNIVRMFGEVQERLTAIKRGLGR